MRIFLFLALAAVFGACTANTGADDSSSVTDSSETAEETCSPNATDPSQYVIVGFWNNDPTCSGEPMITNAFPVSASAGCYCWPGNSGENSADTFSCDPSNNSFTYTQYNTLTCGVGDDTPTAKTSYTDRCEQDIPGNLYSKIVDYGACGS